MKELNWKIVGVIAVLGVLLAVLVATVTRPAGGSGEKPSVNSGNAPLAHGKAQERLSRFARNIRKVTAGSTESQDLLVHLEKELRSGDEDRIADALTQTPGLDDAELLSLASVGLQVIRQPEYRQDLVVALRNVAGRESLTILADALKDEDPAVRMAAMTSLAVVNRETENAYEEAEKLLEQGEKLPDETALPQMPTEEDLAKIGEGLLSIANDQNEDVRKELNSVLTTMDGELQVVGFQAAANSQYPEVRKDGLADLTGEMGKDKVGLLFSYLNDQDEEIRGQAESFCEHFFGESFGSYQEAASWWKGNAERFNEDMSEKDEGVLDVE